MIEESILTFKFIGYLYLVSFVTTILIATHSRGFLQSLFNFNKETIWIVNYKEISGIFEYSFYFTIILTASIFSLEYAIN